MKFCRVSPKLSMRSCEKNCCQQQKSIDPFSLFKSENASMRFSDLPLFLIDNTKYEFVDVFQNSHRSQKVTDEKESSTRKSCQPHLVSLKFVIIVTVKVCVCSCPSSKQKCYHKKN